MRHCRGAAGVNSQRAFLVPRPKIKKTAGREPDGAFFYVAPNDTLSPRGAVERVEHISLRERIWEALRRRTAAVANPALREWPIDRRINKTNVGDDDPMTIEPIESGLL